MESVKDISQVCVTYRGVIRETYDVSSWHIVKKGDMHVQTGLVINDRDIGRLYFDGKKADERKREQHNGKSVKKLQNQGNQNPCLYVARRLPDGTYTSRQHLIELGYGQR